MAITVGDMRRMIEGLPDHVPVELTENWLGFIDFHVAVEIESVGQSTDGIPWIVVAIKDLDEEDEDEEDEDD